MNREKHVTVARQICLLHMIKRVHFAESTIRCSGAKMGNSSRFAVGIMLALLGATGSASAIFSDGFESGDLSHSENGAGWGQSASTNVRVVSDKAYSGKYSLALTCKGKPNTDSVDGDCANEQRFTLGASGHRELWISYKLYIPDNYNHRDPVTGSDNSKFLALWAETYTESGSWMSHETWRTSDGSSKLSWNPSGTAAGSGQNHNFVDSVFIDKSTDRGKWHQIVYHVKIASGAGKRDGAVQLWKGPAGGELRKYFDVQNVSNWGPDWGGSAGENYFRNGYFMGWSNSGFDADTTFYIDDVMFSTSAPTAVPEPPTSITVD